MKYPMNNKTIWLIMFFLIGVGFASIFAFLGTKEPLKQQTNTKVSKQYIEAEIVNYGLTSKECGRDSTLTWSGLRINPQTISKNKFVAMSRDLIGTFKVKPFDIIYIIEPFCFNGYWVIIDKSGKDIKNRIEVVYPSGQIGGKWKCKFKFSRL